MKRMMVGIWLLAWRPQPRAGRSAQEPSFETGRTRRRPLAIAKGAGRARGDGIGGEAGGRLRAGLSGGGKTRVWRIVSQDVPARRDGFYRLTFEARATGLRLDANQFDNAWSGSGGGGRKIPR